LTIEEDVFKKDKLLQPVNFPHWTVILP
jgi:hypothetical protein